jgi:hypothetical protein
MPMRILSGLMAAAVCVTAAGCARQPDPPPYKPTSSVLQLMEGPIAHAAEVYWGAVSTVVDKDGIHENFPRNDEEWEAVWAAGLTIGESGNLLMMGDRARDNEEWMRLSAAMVDVGMEAAAAAEGKDPEKVLEVGERVYNVCTECHMKYIPEEE